MCMMPGNTALGYPFNVPVSRDACSGYVHKEPLVSPTTGQLFGNAYLYRTYDDILIITTVLESNAASTPLLEYGE